MPPPRGVGESAGEREGERDVQMHGFIALGAIRSVRPVGGDTRIDLSARGGLKCQLCRLLSVLLYIQKVTSKIHRKRVFKYIN